MDYAIEQRDTGPILTVTVHQTLAGDPASSGFTTAYTATLAELGDVYYGATARNEVIAGVAPIGEAWQRAWAEGVANPNPYSRTSALPSLWYGDQLA